MASAMLPGSVRNRLRNVAIGFMFMSSLQHSGNALVRANTIPMAAMAATAAAVPAAVAPIATMAARAITTNSIGIVPYERLTRAATIDQMSSFKPARALQPVFKEATIQAVNRARQVVLSEETRNFRRFAFPEYPISEIGGDYTPAVTPSPVPTAVSDFGSEVEFESEYETASQTSEVSPGLLAGMQQIPDAPAFYAIPNAFSITAPSAVHSSAAASSVIAPASVITSSSSGIQMHSGSIFSGQQSRVGATSVVPPSQQPDILSRVSRTQPSLNAVSRTSSRQASAASSVVSGFSGWAQRGSLLIGMHPFSGNAQDLFPEPARGSPREVMLLNLSLTNSLAEYPRSISLSTEHSSRRSRELSPSPVPEPAVVEIQVQATESAALPPALLNFTARPLGARQKHATWHCNRQWPEPPRRQGMKRSYLQAELGSGFEMFGKRICFGGPSAGLDASAY